MLKKGFVVASSLPLTTKQSAKIVNLAQRVERKFNITETQRGVLNLDLTYVGKQLQKWNKIMNPVIPFYAIKSLPDKKVIGKLTHFDCASKDEINSVLSTGVHPSNIIYANTTKTEPYIKYANNNGVTTMTADSLHECEKIVGIDKRIKIVLRLAVNDKGAKTSFSNKFGITNFDDFNTIIKYLEVNGGHVYGFSFHVGSGQDNQLLYKEALDKVDRAIDHIRWKAPKLYHGIGMIDIGGGFSDGTDLQVLRKIIEPYVNKYKDYKWISEPGRYFSENAGILFCPIIGKKKMHGKTCYVIADNIYQTFSNIKHDKYKIELGNDTLVEEGHIFGNSCDSEDTLYSGKLPEMDVGTVIIFLKTGAYTCASSCNFNGLEKPIVSYLNI